MVGRSIVVFRWSERTPFRSSERRLYFASATPKGSLDKALARQPLIGGQKVMLDSDLAGLFAANPLE